MNKVVFNALEMKKTRLPLSDLHSLMFNILITLTIFLIFLITLAVFFCDVDALVSEESVSSSSQYSYKKKNNNKN